MKLKKRICRIYRNKHFFVYLLFHLSLIQISAKSLILINTDSSSLNRQKDESVTELKVSGILNNKLMLELLWLYPNVEQLDMYESRIIKHKDQDGIKYNENEIPAGMFSKREKLKNIVLPQGVTKIAKGAFWNCTQLKSVSLPPNLKVIDQFAFQKCKNLLQITFPEGLETIGGGAFQNCTSLRHIKSMGLKPALIPDWNPFNGINYSKCSLLIPENSVSIYENTIFWKDFKIIPIKNN